MLGIAYNIYYAQSREGGEGRDVKDEVWRMRCGG
jgi:hypothetical protein